jgi:hypothetical protein
MNSARFVFLSLFVLSVTAVAQNAIPFINLPLVPVSAEPSGKGFVLTVNGAGFVSGSTVNWNGQALATTFVSAIQLKATVPASDISKPGTASITVASPGVTSSNPVFFPVRLPSEEFKVQQNSFGPPSGPVAVADFNGDGNLDFANLNIGELEITLGHGDGTFEVDSFVFENIGCDGGGLVTGDFNGDGIVDLAATCGTTTTVALGKGDGTFQTAFFTATSTSNNTLAAGDFNHDGKMDLVLGGVGANNVGEITVLLGKGDGTFEAPRYIPVNHSNQWGVTFVTTADINRDGNLDLAVISGNSGIDHELFILLGKGDGSFQVLPRLKGQVQYTLALGDFNGDGNLDLAIPFANKVFISLGNGDGTFGTPTGYKTAGSGFSGIQLGDFDGDGILDIAVSANEYPGDSVISLLRGAGDGTFKAGLGFQSNLYVGNYLAAGDFNNDGKLDLLLSTSQDFGGANVFLQSSH